MKKILLMLAVASFLFSKEEFDCSKKYCKEMSSCKEAMHYLNVCKVAKFDKDGDGIPCENVCGKGGKGKK
ncbi:excalibur calcium-binding domain-containing protein [Campylobacter sp. 9BO]|uniref:excalibur calcium-binding domain-containing protein n=1 Tax=Campylobacter sp. 9BO TaxID=3424759 RepID=UPI003D328917